MLPRIAIASLGGTITMSHIGGSGGLVSAHSAVDLVAALPPLGDVAEVSASALAAKPSASLDLSDILSALAWAREQVESGSDGVVLLQGTDTLEETAYLMSLYWDRDEPLVLTGAMRGADHLSSDGPSNLLSATTVAASAGSRARGVIVVMDEQIHAARRVSKTDSMATDAFGSGVFGPLGRLREGHVAFANELKRTATLPLPRRAAVGDVALVETTLGDDGTILRTAQELGLISGVVIAGFGAGHVPASWLPLVTDLLDSMPVVIATRGGSGSVLRSTYDFAGSERDLLHRGVVSAGWLAPRKARLLLWAALASGINRAEIPALFESHGDSI